MASDVLLEAGATIDITPYEAGLAKMVDETAASTGAVKASFESAAAADAAVSKSVQSMATTTAFGFANVKSGGILAFDAIRAKVIEATTEVGRLRSEILETNDAVRLEQLQSQLARARAEMTAARTELKALGFESNETREKMSLLAESVGTRMPAALGRLLSQIPSVQAAMAAMFQVTIIVFFISMIEDAIEKLGEMATAAGGFGKAAEAAYEKALDANSRMLIKSLELQEAMDKVGVVGTEGVVKYARESKNAEEAMHRQAELLREQNKELQKANDEVTELQKKVSLGKTWIGTDGIKNYEEELQRATAHANRLNEVVTELQAKLVKRPAEVKTRVAEERVAELEQEIRSEVSATEARKKLADSYVDYFVAGTKRLFTAGQINLEEETANERAAATQKLEIFRAYTAERIAELKREAAAHPGKNVEPEVVTLKTNLETQEIATRTHLEEIDASSDERRVTHANAVSLALAQASKNATDLEATNEEQGARRKLSARQISIDQESAILKDSLTKRITAEQEVLEEELRIANRNPYQNQEKIITLNQQLINSRKELANQEAAIDEEAALRKTELARREQEEELRFTRETSNLTLEATRRNDESRLRSHAITLSQWADSESAAINTWYAEQSRVLQAEAEFAARTFGATSLEYRKALNEMSVLDQRYANERQRIDEKVAAGFQQSMNVVSRSFTSAFDRILTEHTNFGAVMASFWNQMVQGWARMGAQIVANYIQSLAQIVLQETLSALRIQVIHTQSTSAKQATEILFDSFLNLLGIKRAAKETAELTVKKAAHAAETATEITSTTTTEAAKTLAVTAGETARTGAVTTGVVARTAIEETGQTTSVASIIASNVLKVISEAGLAGAAAFASVMAALPFPTNIATAPGVTAAAVSGTLANLSLASAEAGTTVEKAQPVLVHSGELITDTTSLNALSASSNASRSTVSAMNVTSDQIVMLREGNVVVPKALAAGLTTAFSSTTGFRSETAPGSPVPFGVKEVPQRLASSTSSAISKIIENTKSSTVEGGAKFFSAREGIVLGGESLLSMREGGVVERTMLSAREGLVLGGESLLSMREGGVIDRAVFSAAEGLTIERSSNALAAGATAPINFGLAAGLQLPAFGAPAALKGTITPPSSSASTSTTVNNKTVHVRPEIHVHQSEKATGALSVEDIAGGVNLGIRRGLINVNV